MGCKKLFLLITHPYFFHRASLGNSRYFSLIQNSVGGRWLLRTQTKMKTKYTHETLNDAGSWLEMEKSYFIIVIKLSLHFVFCCNLEMNVMVVKLEYMRLHGALNNEHIVSLRVKLTIFQLRSS